MVPRIRLLAVVAEGRGGQVVSVSRTRARVLVNGGQAARVIDPELTEHAVTGPGVRGSRGRK